MSRILRYNRFLRPRGLITAVKAAVFQRQRNRCHSNWTQVSFRECVHDDRLLTTMFDRAGSATGLTLSESRTSVIVHYGYGSVRPHRDNMSKSCLLIPIQVTRTQELVVDRRAVSLQSSSLFRFNDHHVHAINNPHGGLFILLSLTNDA